MARAKRAATAKTKTATTDKTLYCSFCGKSQHDVRKLIAGPKTFICDECVELCLDIVQETDGAAAKTQDGFTRYRILVGFDEPFSPQEEKLLPAIINSIEDAYPKCRVSMRAFHNSTEGAALTILFDSPTPMAASSADQLREEVRELTVQLRIAQERFLAEKSERERFENLYIELTKDVLPIVIKELRTQGRIHQFNTKTLLVFFADVVGFSEMSEEDRTLKVDLLRLIGRSILQSENGMYINTWGDGLIAAFEDPNQGLRCACKFVSHLDLDGIGVRVGVNWGLARIVYNEMTERLDIDGDSINMGARLEPLAEPGEVVASEIVIGLPELDKENFILAEREVKLKKAIAGKSAGETLTVYNVKYYPNK